MLRQKSIVADGLGPRAPAAGRGEERHEGGFA